MKIKSFEYIRILVIKPLLCIHTTCRNVDFPCNPFIFLFFFLFFSYLSSDESCILNIITLGADTLNSGIFMIPVYMCVCVCMSVYVCVCGYGGIVRYHLKCF